MSCRRGIGWVAQIRGCNADEGDPGTFNDRLLMEGYPFRLVEAMVPIAR